MTRISNYKIAFLITLTSFFLFSCHESSKKQSLPEEQLNAIDRDFNNKSNTLQFKKILASLHVIYKANEQQIANALISSYKTAKKNDYKKSLLEFSLEFLGYSNSLDKDINLKVEEALDTYLKILDYLKK